MGEITCYHLAKRGYVVFAGVYMKESFEKLKKEAGASPHTTMMDAAILAHLHDHTRILSLHLNGTEAFSPGCEKRVIPVQIDITNSESIKKAAEV